MSIKDREKNPKKAINNPNIVKTFISGETSTEEDYLYRSFHIEPAHAKALAYEKLQTGRNLSEIVRDALNKYFEDSLEQFKD